jgi:hypothetical protein
MPVVGADLAELNKLVSTLNGPDRQQLTSSLNEMNGAIQDSKDYWVSDYGDKFRRDFSTYVARTQERLDQVLAQAARVTGQNLSAIAAATGEGSGPDSGGGQFELTADVVALPSASSAAADGPGEVLQGVAAAYGIAEPSRAAIQDFYQATTGLWQGTTHHGTQWTGEQVLHDHNAGGPSRPNGPPHGPDFDVSSDGEYAKTAYQFLQDAAAKGYDIKGTGTVGSANRVLRVYDPATNTFGSYRNDGTVKTFFKPSQPNYWSNPSNGTTATPAELQGVADRSAALVDQDSSWLGKAGRLLDTTPLSRLGQWMETPAGRVGGKIMGGLAVAGDLLTIVDPSPDALGGPDMERAMAAANLGAMVVTAGPVEALLAANSLDVIPGVGEVVLAATAIYFVSDLVYENRKAIGHALSWAGHETLHLGSDLLHDIF